MADCPSILARLEKARAALDDIMTGNAVSRYVDQNGESVSYSKINATSLVGYIAKLEADYAACIAGTSPLSYRGPLKFTFGRRPC